MGAAESSAASHLQTCRSLAVMRTEAAVLLSQPADAERKYPQPLPFGWRLRHALSYLIGGISFTIASISYFPSISNYSLGGWGFTIGSAAFLYADVIEWALNNHVGCCLDEKYRKDFERLVSQTYSHPETFHGQFQRASPGLNFATSVCGSFLYLLGSVFFIPSTGLLNDGTEIFIYGSALIFLSQSIKVFRQGCNNVNDARDFSFSIHNYANDLPALGVDTGAGIGGLLYLIGSVYFLPENDVSDSVTRTAAFLFTLAGLSFVASGCFIVTRYFFVYPPKFPI